MKKSFIIWVACVAGCVAAVQAQIDSPSRVYDVVTDNDSCYFFSDPKPCFDEGVFHWAWAPTNMLLQEYVAPGPMTVYGVAITFENLMGSLPLNDTSLKVCLYKRVGPGVSSPNTDYYEFTPVDMVTIDCAHPRFCWFLYEDACNEKNHFQAPCYEFYFDTPKQINLVTDTFYVGRRLDWSPGLGFSLKEYGARYDNSLPAHTYMDGSRSQNAGNRYMLNDWYDDKRWGWAFPIIGFRCGQIQEYHLDSYTGDTAVVRWRSVEEGTLYNVRLVGSDGSDTTYITSDTAFTFTELSENIRYNVMLRKQCHYATTNYDTTVYGQWLSTLSFGFGGANPPNGISQPEVEAFTVAPNPAQGSVRVMLPGSARGGQVSLCDLTGRVLTVRTVTGSEMELDLGALPTGVYLVKLTTSRGISAQRVIVTR